MRRGSARAHTRRIIAKKKTTPRAAAAKSALVRRSKGSARPSARGRVRVVGSRSTRARRPTRPLPPADAVSERVFLSSLERSLRDYRTLWEALAKR